MGDHIVTVVIPSAAERSRRCARANDDPPLGFLTTLLFPNVDGQWGAAQRPTTHPAIAPNTTPVMRIGA